MSPTETSFSQIILNTLDTIARKGAGFKSLADAWVDTTTPHGRLTVTILGSAADPVRTQPARQNHMGAYGILHPARAHCGTAHALSGAGYRAWLAQLPLEQARNIAHANAERLFNGKVGE